MNLLTLFAHDPLFSVCYSHASHAITFIIDVHVPGAGTVCRVMVPLRVRLRCTIDAAERAIRRLPVHQAKPEVLTETQ